MCFRARSKAKRSIFAVVIFAMAFMCGCAAPREEVLVSAPTVPTTAAAEETTEPSESTGVTEPTEAVIATVPTEPTETTVPTEPEEPKRLIVIDAGHQGKSNRDKEPVGPGSDEMKTKVASGTTGCVSGMDEYELNLIVALMLQEELESRGYEVVMIRTTHDVDISNAERAVIANEAGADAFIRIHADGSESSSAQGALAVCQTAKNPYQPEMYEVNRRLAETVIDAYCAVTGCVNRGVWATDTMTGINWCEVPNCIVELGFMSNPEEDARMATPEYQQLMVQGIADGLDAFFEHAQEP